MADPHQVNAIIAAAITECRKDHAGGAIHPAEAKLIAKCVIERLADAGLRVRHSDEQSETARPV